MSKKYGTFSFELLKLVGESTGLFAWPLEYSESWRYEQLKNHKSKKIYDNLYSLKRRGLIKEVAKNNKRFIKITKKGELETLFIKAHLEPTKKSFWDGKWRLVFFDIPEDSRDKRDKIRRLLKEKGFIKLQASVFISPHPLSRAAVIYLKQSKLINYIRFAKIQELDDDKDLKKKFKLV